MKRFICTLLAATVLFGFTACGVSTSSEQQAETVNSISTTAQLTTARVTTIQPTTARPTTAQPTTEQPTTEQPTTAQPTTEQPTTQAQDDSWKQLYIDMINNNSDPSSFSLIKVDNDDIPELIFTGSAVGGTQIAWVNDGELQKQVIGYGGVKYLEKQGLLYCDYVNNGIYKDFVFKLENGSLSEVFQGTSGTWIIGGESVGETEYKSELNSAFDFDNAKSPDNSYSRTEIISVINNY